MSLSDMQWLEKEVSTKKDSRKFYFHILSLVGLGLLHINSHYINSYEHFRG